MVYHFHILAGKPEEESVSLCIKLFRKVSAAPVLYFDLTKYGHYEFWKESDHYKWQLKEFSFLSFDLFISGTDFSVHNDSNRNHFCTYDAKNMLAVPTSCSFPLSTLICDRNLSMYETAR